VGFGVGEGIWVGVSSGGVVAAGVGEGVAAGEDAAEGVASICKGVVLSFCVPHAPSSMKAKEKAISAPVLIIDVI
jgi:hypothetical protein